jgi:Secretion system C-terminal sorting domain
LSLSYFTAQKQPKSVLLNWQTATEINTNKFIIERSKNATNFETVNTVTAAGNSSTIRNYNCLDLTPYNGINYYRLKQIDKDGSFVYSKTVTINFSIKGSIVYPNPASQIITIVTANKLKVVEVINAEGKIFQRMKSSSNGRYNISSLPMGTYSLRLIYENDQEVLQLNKQ